MKRFELILQKKIVQVQQCHLLQQFPQYKYYGRLLF